MLLRETRPYRLPIDGNKHTLTRGNVYPQISGDRQLLQG